MSDQMLISRFYPELLDGFPAPQEGVVGLHAELLHRICLADGLLEVLEWSRQGLGADPLACMWLAGLRWYRLVTGEFPDGAPYPPPRETDAALGRLLGTGALSITAGTGETSISSLSSAELHYPAAPAQPQSTDEQVLLRLAPLALVPYVDEQMRMRWVEQNLSMTHGAEQLLGQGRRLVTDLHHRAGSAQHAPGHEPSSPPPESHPLFSAVAELAQRWAQVTAEP